MHPQPVVAGRFPDFFDAKFRQVEHETVISLELAEFADDRLDAGRIRRAEPEKIRVACRAVLLIEPVPEQHGPLEQEVVPVAGDRQAIKEALDGITVECELELLSSRPCMVEQALADRVDAAWRRHAHATDSR